MIKPKHPHWGKGQSCGSGYRELSKKVQAAFVGGGGVPGNGGPGATCSPQASPPQAEDKSIAQTRYTASVGAPTTVDTARLLILDSSLGRLGSFTVEFYH